MSIDAVRKAQEELARLREMHAQTTDPLATRLLEDIIVELEAGLAPPTDPTASDTQGG